MTDKPTTRALIVFEAVAAHGPVTLKRLTALLPAISRPAIWRALDTLRAQGWVRMRRVDNAFQVTPRIDDIMADTTTAPLPLVELDALIPPPPKDVALTIGLFADTGRFVYAEGAVEDASPVSLLTDPGALAALALLDRVSVVRHVARWLEDAASDAERDQVSAGALAQRLAGLGPRPVVWAADGARFCIGWRASDGAAAGLNAAAIGRAGREALDVYAEDLEDSLISSR